MVGRKIVFIIPGFRHKPTQKAYKEIARNLRKEGYLPVPITIPWKQRTISENTQHFLKEYKKKLLLPSLKGRKQTYFMGFSFGAMIAFIASTKVAVNGLLLCSLSPYFKEDSLTALKSYQYEDSHTLHCRTLAKKVKAKKVIMMYGAKETKPLIKRVTAAYRQVESQEKYLLRIKQTDHDINDKKYLYAINRVTTTFL